MCPTNQNHVVARRPPLESIKVGSSASPGQQVTETRGGVLKLSKVGLGTLEATERQLQHPAADHGASSLSFVNRCLWGRSVSITSLQRRGGGERWPGCPKEEKPRWGSCFFKNLCFVCIFWPHFPLFGVKRYIVYCLMGCLPLLLKPSRDQGASRRNMLWGDKSNTLSKL